MERATNGRGALAASRVGGLTMAKEQKLYYYPFKSSVAKDVRALRKLGDKERDWRHETIDLDEAFKKTRGPILEIGGPTATGYYYLENRKLSQKPIITNIDEGMGKVNRIIDGRHLPCDDNSLGVVLSSHIPRYDLLDPKVHAIKLRFIRQRVWNHRLKKVNKMIADMFEKNYVHKNALKLSLRYAIAAEVFKKLKPGGLYLTDGRKDEVGVLNLLGFVPIAALDEGSLAKVTDDDEEVYSIVLQKPIGS